MFFPRYLSRENLMLSRQWIIISLVSVLIDTLHVAPYCRNIQKILQQDTAMIKGRKKKAVSWMKRCTFAFHITINHPVQSIMLHTKGRIEKKQRKKKLWKSPVTFPSSMLFRLSVKRGANEKHRERTGKLLKEIGLCYTAAAGEPFVVKWKFVNKKNARAELLWESFKNLLHGSLLRKASCISS